MVIVLLIGFFAVLFAFIAREKRLAFLLKVSFGLIFIFQAVRYDYGNDYNSYFYSFLEINSDKFTVNLLTDFYYEPGWVLLCRLFEPFGFFALVASLALFTTVVYYRFIARYVSPQYYWLAVFIYFYSPNIMLTMLSAMRQGLAIAIFVFAIDYLIKKNAVKYCLCILIAATFHTSAIILLPVYALSFLRGKINTYAAIGVFFAFVGLLVVGDNNILLAYLNTFIESYFPQYSRHHGGTSVGSGAGVIISITIFAFLLFYEKKQTRDAALLFRIALLSFLFIPLSLSIAMLTRVGFYFEPALIAAYPCLLGSTKDYVRRKIFIAIILFIILYTFFSFFQSDTWKIDFGTYHTIFEASRIY